MTRFLLSGNTLADLGFNQGGRLSTIWAIRNQLGPPRDAKNCDVSHMQEDGGSPRWQYASEDVTLYRHGTVLMGTNQKEDSPVKMARRVIEVMLTGCVQCVQGC